MRGDRHQFQAIIPVNPQKVAYTASAAQSSAIQKHCSIIRIFPTTDCYIKISTAGTAATTSDIFCPGGIAEYFELLVDGPYIISAIRDTTSGTLHIVEGA